jgi:hypothetical protein
MATLSKELRRALERAVLVARDIAEKGVTEAIVSFGVGDAKAPPHLDEAGKLLRRKLRAHGRQVGDKIISSDIQDTSHLAQECAYEHWHRMLFASFLEANHLLLWEPGAAFTLDNCQELIDQSPELALGSRTKRELAGKLAARMLPQVFKPQSPVFELAFAPEHQRELERLLAGLPSDAWLTVVDCHN